MCYNCGMLRKILLSFLAVAVSGSLLVGILTDEANAATPAATTVEPGLVVPGDIGYKECATSFLGFRPWYQGLHVDIGLINPNAKTGSYDHNVRRCAVIPPCARDASGASDLCPDGSVEITVFVWTVALNILFNLFLVVGYLSVGFLMYGGYSYMMAQGNQSKIERGKKTVTSAVIGTVIAVFATIISNTITAIVSNNGKQWGRGDDGSQLLSNVLGWAYIALGVLGVIMMIYAGFQWVTSGGDAGKAKAARMTMIYAAAGTVVVIMASAITSVIAGAAG